MNDLSQENGRTRSVANIATSNASRYLQQLCKHFAHKLPVTFDPSTGLIAFSIGDCQLKAREGFLAISLTVPDASGIATLQEVVANHLTRFAFRENLRIDWCQS